MNILHLKMCGFPTYYMKKLICLKNLKSHSNTNHVPFGWIHEIIQNDIKFQYTLLFHKSLLNVSYLNPFIYYLLSAYIQSTMSVLSKKIQRCLLQSFFTYFKEQVIEQRKWDKFGEFPRSSAGKETACNAGDPGLIPESGRSPGEGVGCPLQYSWASLVAQSIKNLSTMWKTWV